MAICHFWTACQLYEVFKRDSAVFLSLGILHRSVLTGLDAKVPLKTLP